MRGIGVICEYNPFHNGHAYHLQKCRQLAGDDCAIICVMSGDFMQRGEAALFSKFARAEAACLGGADLVVELPLPWSLSSAEGFARGGVSILNRMGAKSMGFGSETGEAETLRVIAELLLDPMVQEEIKKHLRDNANTSYASARQLVLRKKLGAAADVLGQPNNILGIEYIKAILETGASMVPFSVLRQGAGHDDPGGSPGFRSASELRQMLLNGESIAEYSPVSCSAVFDREREHGRQLDPAVMEIAILSRLRMLDEEVYHTLPDASNGLGMRLYKAVQKERNLAAVHQEASTKRYPLARIRRLCMCACLGIKDGAARGEPPYARILAANEKGRAYLASQRKNTKIPILIKPASVSKLSPECSALFALGARAHSFYTLGYGADAQYHPSEDWEKSLYL